MSKQDGAPQMRKGGVVERTGAGHGDSLTGMESPCAQKPWEARKDTTVHRTGGSLQPDVADCRAGSCWHLLKPCDFEDCCKGWNIGEPGIS